MVNSGIDPYYFIIISTCLFGCFWNRNFFSLSRHYNVMFSVQSIFRSCCFAKHKYNKEWDERECNVHHILCVCIAVCSTYLIIFTRMLATLIWQYFPMRRNARTPNNAIHQRIQHSAPTRPTSSFGHCHTYVCSYREKAPAHTTNHILAPLAKLTRRGCRSNNTT